MAARVELRGLDEFRRAMRSRPSHLAQEALAIVDAHSEEATRLISDGYPEGPTGNLKRGVRRNLVSSRFGGSAVVRSRAPHASIFEHGTERRTTDKGYNRGAMPQPDERERFIPKAIRIRRRMVAALTDMLRRNGFQVDL